MINNNNNNNKINIMNSNLVDYNNILGKDFNNNNNNYNFNF